MVHPYSCMNTATVWNKSRFILSDRLDFHMIDSLQNAFYAFVKRMLTSLLVVEMLLLRYVNWCTSCRDLTFWVEMAPFCLKPIYSLFALRYAVGILFGLVNLWEVLDHLRRGLHLTVFAGYRLQLAKCCRYIFHILNCHLWDASELRQVVMVAPPS